MFDVVADSNVFISALVYGGKPLQLLEIGLEREIHLIISPAILEETLEVLDVVKDDPDDNKILELAAQIGDVIVSADMKLTERFTRISPTQLEYRFTVDDPTVWTKPWTAMFVLDRDDDQYELVEYACHEANYGTTNILSGAREADRDANGGKK